MKSLASQEEDGQEGRDHDGEVPSRRTLVAAHHGSGMSDNGRRSGGSEPNKLGGHGSWAAGCGGDVSRTARGGEESPRISEVRLGAQRDDDFCKGRVCGLPTSLVRLFWVNGSEAEQGTLWRSKAGNHNSRYGRCGIYPSACVRFDKRRGSGRGSKFARADRLASCLCLPCPPRLAHAHTIFAAPDSWSQVSINLSSLLPEPGSAS